MKNKIVNSISEILEPTEEQKKRMFTHILDKHKNGLTEKKSLTSMRCLKPALVSAILVFCLISTTVFAAAYWGLDSHFLRFLKPSNYEQEKYLANGTYVIDKQVANTGGILHIKQVIGDGNLTYILMDFTTTNGTPLNMARYRFLNNDFNADQNFYSIDFISLSDENTTDNKISMIMSIMTKKSLMGQKVNLELADLQGATSSTGSFDTIISGKWKTSFLLNFKEYSTNYQVNKEITMYDHAATVKTISISPISIAINIESPFLEKINKNSSGGLKSEQNEYLDNYPITIHYKNGISETTTTFKGMYLAECGLGKMLIIKTFENIINENEIKSISFFGAEIPVPQATQN